MGQREAGSDDLMTNVTGDVTVFLFRLHFLVKPLPPSNIKAEITRNDGLLNVSWTNPVFTNDDLKFQIRYAVNREELTWEVLSFSIQSEA